MTKRHNDIRTNARLAKKIWGAGITNTAITALKEITRAYSLSIAAGDLLYLGSHWYVTHSGLLRLALRKQLHRYTHPSSLSVLRCTLATMGLRS